MSPIQGEFDFTQRIENNQESQDHLKLNSDKFNRQCRHVYEILQSGERLTTASALLKYRIGDLRRRIKDLIDFAGIQVQKEWMEIKNEDGTKSRFKVYYLKQN
jgi:hypothetical protein